MMFRFLLFVFLIGIARAQSPVSLIPEQNPLEVWRFNNGREFPGATGGLTMDAETTHGAGQSLKLVGDFTNGGGYVQAGRRLDNIEIRDLSLWVKAEGTDNFTLRLGDASGQTHQIKLKLEKGTGWRKVSLPLEEFFRNRGKSNAVTGITNYQYWGGAKDGNWHGPATGMYLLLGKGSENTVRTLWLADIEITPPPRAVEGAEETREFPLSDIVDGIHDWRFSKGPEFKGAKGSLTAGDEFFTIEADFTEGGAYVAAIRDLPEIDTGKVQAFRMKMKSENAKSFTVQLVDATGQTHQRKAIPLNSGGEWKDVVLNPNEIAGGEHWGGANDGKWHDPPKRLVLSITTRSDVKKKPVVALSDVHAEVTVPVFATPPAYQAEFPIQLSRTVEQINTPENWSGDLFPASTGKWEISCSYRSNLNSPDNSYSGVLLLDAVNADGATLETFTVIDTFGENISTEKREVFVLPRGTKSGRFRAELRKASGEFSVEELRASCLAPAPVKNTRIERMLFSSEQLGNLLFPETPRTFSMQVDAVKPLKQKTVNYVVSDYWGAEQTEKKSISLSGPERRDGKFIYTAEIDLSEVPLEIGRYYELHAEAGGGDDQVEPFRNYSSFAILPEAETKKLDPMEVPFTARNWDNRIVEFVRLTDRLGVRICGLWGGWSSKPPYKPQAPRLDLCRELGMGWLTTTPIKHIERGRDEDWPEEALRQGTRNFLEAYAHERPMIINLGNEPHGTGERVKKNVEAYRIVFEEVKKFDPTIPVVATSVEPNEEYFRNGYGQWCDAFDFHIYEHHSNVRRTIEKYRKLMEKYDVVKPIWSTELGLNSQGQARYAVSLELIKKFATFFAAGGENVSWFGLLYPDNDAKNHGSSGDSHNVFDCRYNRYAPRLDAVTYYHAVNAIADRKFVEEKNYPDGTSAFLFRNEAGECLQIIWNEENENPVYIPFPDVKDVGLTYLDGSKSVVNAAGRGITLGVSRDPVLLRYHSPQSNLAENLQKPKIGCSIAVTKQITIQVDSESGEYKLSAPPMWEVIRSGDQFSAMAPENTSVREAEFVLRSNDNNGEVRFRVPVGLSR